MPFLKISEKIAQFPIIKNFVSKTNTLSKVPSNQVHIQVVQEMVDKNRKDNKDWRDAIRLADDTENPNWSFLQDFYDYLIVDAQTHSLIELRNAATLSSRFYVYNATTNEEQPQKTAILQTEWFYNFITEVLLSQARGFTVAQLINLANMTFDYIPRRNIVIQKNFVRLSVGSEVGVSLLDEQLAKYIITVKSNYIYGYMNDIVPLILWKLNALMSWAEATEKYGIPPLIATTNKSDDKSLATIQAMLKNAGESLSSVLPEGTKVEVMQNSEKIDPEKMFGGLLKVCDDAIAKRIVGGTMITADGSSRSQSEVHQSNFDEKIAEADKRKCEFVVNGQLIPMMAHLGFNENDRFTFDRSQKLSPKEVVDMLEKMLNHYDVDEDWIKKNTQIPITTKKEVSPFNKASSTMVAVLEASGVQLPNYKHSTCGHAHQVTADALFDDARLMELADALINNVWNSEDTLINLILKSIETNTILKNAFLNGFKDRLKFDYDAPATACLANMEYNIMDFSLAKSKADVLMLNQLLIDKEKNNIRTFNDFKQAAQPYIKKTNTDYLRTEYNHTIAVGQNASAYLKFKAEEDSITQFVQWQTVGDSNVRAKHAALNGRIFDLKEQGGLTIVPPKEWGCRCELVQYLGKPPKELLTTNDNGLTILGIKKGDKWDVNRAEAQQVFTANEMYVKDNQLSDVIDGMTFKEYGLQPISEMQNLAEIKLDKTITKANVKKLFKPIEGKSFMGFEDYLGRKLQLSKYSFDKHTKGHYTNTSELRHQLFPFIEDVLKNADEVYFFKYRGQKNYYQTNYIKHYKGRSVVVNTQVGDDGVAINTWYNLKQDEKIIRSGFLIHQNKKS
jgi:SPP1 gp7 family putative phage head morphogenesis protein